MLAVESRFTGASGLDAMGAAVADALVPQRLQTPDPHRFTASVTSVDLGSVQLVRASAPPMRSVRPVGSPARPDGAAFLLLGRGARGEIAGGGVSAPVDPDHLVLIPGDAAFEVTYPERVEVVFVALDAPGALRLGLAVSGPLRGLALPAAGRALLAPALDAVQAAAAAATPADVADLAEVVEGALGVAVRAAAEPVADPRAAVRAAALRLVDRHLRDPDLGPGWLAACLHLSPSTLHRAFRAGEETVAAMVRRRRVEAVARDLTGPAPGPGVSELAARYGFAGGSHLATAFRARYALSPAEYRARHGSAHHLRRS
ncbi:helix-turn-helix domain-containing protein [Pseudonocardia humida]|uniref:Helix-turn-helix domain-containing protein n=1 Tax=Pseudonocardia humida TaxID=2800819 RepID=A0ABT1A228_9PSEU|nr:helix-turn-helix domain-containing protein [Pseudonocardia humida]MCO1657058.1 helix-turn-helix domain-containing protein [Pseudonocardia humida]